MHASCTLLEDGGRIGFSVSTEKGHEERCLAILWPQGRRERLFIAWGGGEASMQDLQKEHSVQRRQHH